MSNKDTWNIQSRVIAARLHPDNAKERLALEIFDKKREKHSARKIITDSLIRSAGYTPELFDSDDKTITQSQLERTLEEFANYIIEQIQANGMTVKPIIQDESNVFTDDEDMTVMKNMAAGFLNRRKGR